MIITIIVWILALWKIGDFIGWNKIKNVIKQFIEGSERKEDKEIKKDLNTSTNCVNCGKDNNSKKLCKNCWIKERYKK